MSARRRNARPRSRVLRAALLLPVLVSAVAAQTTQPAAESGRVRLAGAADELWLIHVRAQDTALFRRTATEDFELLPTVFGRIALAAVQDGQLYFFLDDGQFYSVGPRGAAPRVEIELPQRAMPESLASTDQELLATLRGTLAAGLGDPPADGAAVGDGLEIAAYDGRRWKRVAAVPAPLAEARPLRIVAVDGAIVAAGLVDGQVRTRVWRNGRWGSPETPPVPRDPLDFWLLTANSQPTLVAAVANEDDRGWISVARKIGGPDKPWRAIDPHPSSLPSDPSQHLLAATAFAQHIAVLVGQDDGDLLAFVRCDTPPALETLALDELLLAPERVRTARRIAEITTFAILATILTCLFALRRDSMLQSVVIPPGFGLPSVLLRLLAFLVDLLPFSFLAASLVGVAWRDAITVLGSMTSEATPVVQSVGWWWALSVGMYTTYVTLMECFTGRTVGKLLIGAVVFSERGTRPVLWQVLLRNALRAIELLPQFWIFGLLVLLSRNQQRLGDIFARTYVARRLPIVVARPGAPDGDAARRPPADDGGDGDDSEEPAGDEGGTDRSDGQR